MNSSYTLEKRPIETLIQALWRFREKEHRFPNVLTFSAKSFDLVRKHRLVCQRVVYAVDDVSDGVSVDMLTAMLAPPNSEGDFVVRVVETLPDEAQYVFSAPC